MNGLPFNLLTGSFIQDNDLKFCRMPHISPTICLVVFILPSRLSHKLSVLHGNFLHLYVLSICLLIQAQCIELPRCNLGSSTRYGPCGRAYRVIHQLRISRTSSITLKPRKNLMDARKVLLYSILDSLEARSRRNDPSIAVILACGGK